MFEEVKVEMLLWHNCQWMLWLSRRVALWSALRQHGC